MAKCVGSDRNSVGSRWLNAPQRQDLREASASRWAGVKNGQGMKKLASRLRNVLCNKA